MHHHAYFTDYLHFSPYDCDLHYFQILRWFTWLFFFFHLIQKTSIPLNQFTLLKPSSQYPTLSSLGTWSILCEDVLHKEDNRYSNILFNFINVYVSKVILYVTYCIPWVKYSDCGFAGSLLRMLLGTTPVTKWRN